MRDMIALALFVTAIVVMCIELPVGLFVLACSAVAMPRARQ